MPTIRNALFCQPSLRQISQTAALALAMVLVMASSANAQFGEEPTNYVEVVNAFITVSDPEHDVTRTIPGVVTWQHLVHVRGGGWPAGSTMDIYLRGPLNTLGVEPIERGPFENRDTDIDQNGLWQVDASGNFQGSFRLNYENRINEDGTLPFDPDITQPGLYQIVARRHGVLFPTAFDIAHSTTFSVSPNTLFDSTTPHEERWPEMRGGRDGWLDSTFLATPDPEWTDPEWTTIWSTKPIGLYATVAPTDGNGLNQPAHVAFHEFPASHFGHDWNLHLVPDQDYLWTLATANFAGEEGGRGAERIELEWEGQNDGTPFVGSVGYGDIGMPAFVMGTAGDRVYTVGRWVMDHGHPDEGVRSEIHPPRMIATMRKRHTVVPLENGELTRAAQVDVFVSGHGGGINISNYDELERFLDNQGKGGARVVDFGLWTSQAGIAYSRFGPAPLFHDSLDAIIDAVGFVGGHPDVFTAAGPSAISTGFDGLPTPGPGLVQWTHSAEFQPVNDMDYEFDVPLPPKPPGATTPLVQVTTHPMHSTSVNEIITYAGGFAHIRLPYQGADNGIYARTLKFYWDTFSPPGDHYVVQIDDIETARALDFETGRISGPQPLYLWADVCGQWRFLTGLFAPDQNPLLIPKIGPTSDPDHASLDGFQGARFDVYLDDSDTLRVFVGGYAQRDLDALYGDAPSGIPLYNMNAYDAGLEVADAVVFGSGDDQNLGGAVYESGAATAVDDSPVRIPAQSDGVMGILGGGFPEPVMNVTFSATFVPRAPRILASHDELGFGTTCPGSSSSLSLQIANGRDAQSSLVVNNFSIVGSGFSLVSPPALPLTLAPGESQSLTIGFSPTHSGAATGTLAVGSNDPETPQLPVALVGLGGSPTIEATSDTGTKPTLTLSSTTTWAVTIGNAGECALSVQPSITGTGGTWEVVLPASYYDPLTGELLDDIVVGPGGVNTDLNVSFTPTTPAFKAEGTLTLVSNDAESPTSTLVFGAEGVPVGVRVQVVGSDGTPYPVVDEIKVKSKKPNKFKSDLADLPLITIDPPESWKRIQYHYMTALDPAEDGSDYLLEVKVDNHKQDITFTLGPDEFQELTVTVP